MFGDSFIFIPTFELNLENILVNPSTDVHVITFGRPFRFVVTSPAFNFFRYFDVNPVFHEVFRIRGLQVL